MEYKLTFHFLGFEEIKIECNVIDNSNDSTFENFLKRDNKFAGIILEKLEISGEE